MTRHFLSRVLCLGALWGLLGCQRSQPADEYQFATTRTAERRQDAASGPVRDLNQDEAAGGHILRKHVGRTDEELLERLDRERNISGASTYTDRATAERALGAAIAQNQQRIQRLPHSTDVLYPAMGSSNHRRNFANSHCKSKYS